MPDPPAMGLVRLARTLSLLSGYVDEHLEAEHLRPAAGDVDDIDLEVRALSL